MCPKQEQRIISYGDVNNLKYTALSLHIIRLTSEHAGDGFRKLKKTSVFCVYVN